MKVIAITLARGGSKGIPGKNKKMIFGKPLICHTIDEVKKSKKIDRYIVATDDEDIIDICKESGVEYFKRAPVEDTQTSADGLLEVLNTLENPNQYIIAEIMCTNPLKTAEDIDGTIEYIEKGDCSVSVARVWDHHPSRLKYIEDGELKDFYPEVPESRRQDLIPEAYARNGSIYVMYAKDLIRNKKRLHNKIVPYIMAVGHTVNIDERVDLLVAEQILIERNEDN